MPTPPTAAPPGPRRRQPMQARSMRSVEAILQAAAQVLVQHGEAGLTTNRVADRAGVSIGTLYQYFSDKQAIVAALVEAERARALAAIEAWLEEAARTGLAPRAVAGGVVQRLLQSFAGDTPARRTLARVAWRTDSDERVAASLREAAERIAAHLQRWSGPALAPDRLYVATRAVLGTLRFAALEASPLIATGGLQAPLVDLVLAVLLPADNPPP